MWFFGQKRDQEINGATALQPLRRQQLSGDDPGHRQKGRRGTGLLPALRDVK